MFVGIDTHKDTLAVAICDPAGTLTEWTEVVNEPSGFAQLERLFAARPAVRVGIEGSGHFGRAVAAHLAGAGYDVREVPTSMTSRERAAKPAQGKTDAVDALAIARITAREADLPLARLKIGLAADLRALLDYRDALVREHHALANRVHAELVGLLPGYHHTHPHLTTTVQVKAVLALLDGDERVRAGLARRRLGRILAIMAEVRALAREIDALVSGHADAIQAIYGAGPIVAARFLAEIVDIARYPNRDAFASANGSAPLAASSGRTVRHRLNRGGNRQLNRALYTMAITRSAPTPKAAPTTSASAPRERPPAKRSAASNGACPTRSTRPCAPTPAEQRMSTPAPTSANAPPDLGEGLPEPSQEERHNVQPSDGAQSS